MAEVQVTKDLENKKLIITYEVQAPREKVWRAYADKEWFEKWWGPEGFETTTKEFNFSPGGRIHYGMKCVDQQQAEWYGQTSWGIMEIQSVDEPHNFVYKDYFSDEDGSPNMEMPVMVVTNSFEEADGKTVLTSTCVGDSAEQIEELIKMGMIEGFSSQLNRLEALMAA